MALNSYQQAEEFAKLAREHHLDCETSTLFQRYRIGKKRYDHPINFVCALIRAFDEVGLHVPDELRARPTDLDK